MLLDISKEIDDYLSDVIFQIHLVQIHRSNHEIYHHWKKFIPKKLRFFQIVDEVSSSKKAKSTLRNEIERMEQLFLAKIDSNKGPDRFQIQLALKLNLFKLFQLEVKFILFIFILRKSVIDLSSI